MIIYLWVFELFCISVGFSFLIQDIIWGHVNCYKFQRVPWPSGEKNHITQSYCDDKRLCLGFRIVQGGLM